MLIVDFTSIYPIYLNQWVCYSFLHQGTTDFGEYLVSFACFRMRATRDIALDEICPNSRTFLKENYHHLYVIQGNSNNNNRRGGDDDDWSNNQRGNNNNSRGGSSNNRQRNDDDWGVRQYINMNNNT